MKKHLVPFFVGFALFSMFFGAGNVIFPLDLGRYAQGNAWYGVFGFVLTAVLIPFSGVAAILLFDGNIHKFFQRLGRRSGILIAFIIIALLGPVGTLPRCIALSFATLKQHWPGLHLNTFCILSVLLIYLCTLKKERILALLGYCMTPLLLLSLATIIFVALATAPETLVSPIPPITVAVEGMKSGYYTMDLVAAFFFSAEILMLLRKDDPHKSTRKHDAVALLTKASIVGAVLLTLVYAGFTLSAAAFSPSLSGVHSPDLLAVLGLKTLGPRGATVVSIAVTLACLTTAIALTAAFSNFFRTEIMREKIGYKTSIIITLLVTLIISTLEFEGIARFLGPTLRICYPALITMTLLNIAHKVTGFKPIKIPVAIVFVVTLVLHFA